MQRHLAFIAGGAALAVVAATLTWAQVNRTDGPLPRETAVPQTRQTAIDLAEAQKGSLAGRLGFLLANNPRQTQFQADVAASSVPVLAPADAALLATARFYPGDRFYALVVRRPGQVIQIHGSTKAFEAPEGAIATPAASPEDNLAARRLSRSSVIAQRAGLANAQVTRTEYGVDISFVRFGAVYDVSFICEDETALECSDAAAAQFAASLQLINGGARP